MENAKDQIVEKLHSAANILVTVSRDPSVDQLAACIGLTLALNKMGKHATAVFSGAIPSTLEFLQPTDTIEKNTDSLRDFIIALDKSKADKLRYKVEDEMVRIFITPYRTSITSDDLVFSQGDFNVDAVVALGVAEQKDFDEAIMSHGRILHDATVISITTSDHSELGSINWAVPQASSLSELVADLSDTLDTSLLDGQIATALLTGIVAETARFSNEKTTPRTMSVSAELMAAGANQQLVASKLDEPVSEAAAADESDKEAASQNETKKEPDNSEAAQADKPEPSKPKKEPGTLEIEHESSEAAADNEQPMSGIEQILSEQPEADAETDQLPAPVWTEPEVTALNDQNAKSDATDDVDKAEDSESTPEDQADSQPGEEVPRTSKLITEPPTMGGRLTANSEPEALDPANDPLGVSNTQQSPLLNRSTSSTTPQEAPADKSALPQPAVSWTPPTPPEKPSEPEPLLTGFTPPPPAWVPPTAPANGEQPFPGSEQSNDAASEPDNTKTLTEIEASVNSIHLGTENVDDARDEVQRALNSSPPVPEPVVALGAQPLGDPIRPPEGFEQPSAGFVDTLAQVIPAESPLSVPPAPNDGIPQEIAALPGFTAPLPPAPAVLPAPPQVQDPNAPPVVPPPFQFKTAPPQQ
ncbi:MAG: hypothetical protein JWM81_700 [Candidatus Saccharibacteria bacterium]|nr:hypothetical protein [Candidatus Saccharibacteria bacterium]